MDVDASGLVRVGRASVIDVREDAKTEPLVLVAWQDAPTGRIFDLIPRDLCPRVGTVKQVCELVETITAEPVRDFLARVFAMRDVFRHFWTCPASIRHHHAEAGGLAVHSLEVAVAAASTSVLTEDQRDLAIAYALTHDIGKLWAYEEGELTREAATLGHEHVGFERMLEPLRELRHSWGESGLVLQSLLSGEWKRDRKRPASAVGNIVNAMDRFSAERYQKTRKFKEPF
jgi:hypothetical protein